MHLRKFAVSALLASTLALLSGCASVYRTPGAEASKLADLAVLEYNGDIAGVGVSEVDGKYRGVGIFRRFELVPGDRSVTVYLANYTIKAMPITLKFSAQAGSTYDLLYEVRPTSTRAGNWNAWIIDKQSGKTVSAKSS